MASKPRPLFLDWNLIAAMIAGGATVMNSDIAAALRSATPEIDNLIDLLHTPDLMSLLQMRRVKLDDEVRDKLFDALESLLFMTHSVVPASVQHYLADLLDPPRRPVGRPKRATTPMQLLQREIREREKAKKDIAEVARHFARHGNDRAAMEAFAKARRITVQSARRRYQGSKKRVEEANAEFLELLKPLMAERLQVSKMADALIKMDGLDIDQQVERLEALFPHASEHQIDLAFGLAARIRKSGRSPAK